MDVYKLSILLDLYKETFNFHTYAHGRDKNYTERMEDIKYLKELNYVYSNRDFDWRGGDHPRITETGKIFVEKLIKNILDAQ